MKCDRPVFCRKMPFSAVVLNWKRMSPEVAASNVGNSMVASGFRNVIVLSNMSAEDENGEFTKLGLAWHVTGNEILRSRTVLVNLSVNLQIVW